MAKRRGRKVHFNLSVSQDPTLWRFDNIQEALRANIDVLSRLIHAGEAQPEAETQETAAVETFSSSEGA